MLQSMGSQRVGCELVIEQQLVCHDLLLSYSQEQTAEASGGCLRHGSIFTLVAQVLVPLCLKSIQGFISNKLNVARYYNPPVSLWDSQQFF